MDHTGKLILGVLLMEYSSDLTLTYLRKTENKKGTKYFTHGRIVIFSGYVVFISI